MRYKKFKIENFKGVRSTEVVLSNGAVSASTLIGLNESGKTTLLEAIYSFSPDKESRTLFLDDNLLPDEASRIPRDRLFSFSDVIAVTAYLDFPLAERQKVAKEIGFAIGGSCDPETLPAVLSVRDYDEYKNSARVGGSNMWDMSPSVRTGRQRNWREPTAAEWLKIWPIFQGCLPAIAYFPTFLSQVPKRVYLSGHDTDQTNSFYRRIFQDILFQIGPKYTIKDQILDRLAADEEGPISQIINAFWGSPRKAMVQQLIDKAGAILSTTITDRWNEIFKTRPAGREIVINFGIEEEADGATPYIEFAIKDGSNRFNIADRSLGFRWFFCFLLFTQFRAKRQGGAGTLFLFDEPASNLHAKAQEKLLESFAEICHAPNSPVYSTHSPYMINPLWLDQSYVVENALISAELKEISEMSVNEESDISAKPYRQYVDLHPDRVSHFQPVLDRLEIKPSLLEIGERTLLVEGKSDYAILKRLAPANLPFKIVPAHGATTLGALIALLRGWNWKFAVMLDSDSEGKASAEKYRTEFILDNEVIELASINPNFVEIETILSPADRDRVARTIESSKKPSKKQIYQYFIMSDDKTLKSLEAGQSPMLADLFATVAETLGPDRKRTGTTKLRGTTRQT